jgi:hypothetical protein
MPRTLWGSWCRPGRHTPLRAVNQELTKSLRRRLRDGSKGMQVTGLRRHKLSRSMAYYFLTAFVIGGALGILQWALLSS